MPDSTMNAGLLALAVLACVVGLGWLALAMEAHWQQVRGTAAAPAPRVVLVLRVLGTAALAASLALCLRADHGSMAPLVWIMSLAGGALVIAFTLSWRPRLLGPLVAWVRRGEHAAE